ncbi:MAG: macro domain-containing protein [Campylobacterales bacterium]|nr:macro domain-containing protein [Campylobacterales bacterium]
MGAGVALAFKNKYPLMNKEYVSLCKKGLIKPGEPTTWNSGDLFSKKITIINFPTKDHWRNKSEYEYIEKGLEWLKNYLQGKDGLSLSLPALGCGHGGLDWKIVKQRIEFYLSSSPAEILIFEPKASKVVKENILLNPEVKDRLEKNNIIIINNNDNKYPIRLKTISEKTLFARGSLSNLSKKSITLICSTKPEIKEKEIIKNFLDFIKDENINLLFGSSAFDKKTIKELSSKTTTLVIPSGINAFCDKKINEEIYKNENTLLLSICDPFIEFDRKEYMNSVLARIYLSDIIFFTTPKLDWIKKYNKKLMQYNGNMFFINYKELSSDIKEDLYKLSIQEINKDAKTLLPKFNLITEVYNKA